MSLEDVKHQNKDEAATSHQRKLRTWNNQSINQNPPSSFMEECVAANLHNFLTLHFIFPWRRIFPQMSNPRTRTTDSWNPRSDQRKIDKIYSSTIAWRIDIGCPPSVQPRVKQYASCVGCPSHQKIKIFLNDERRKVSTVKVCQQPRFSMSELQSDSRGLLVTGFRRVINIPTDESYCSQRKMIQDSLYSVYELFLKRDSLLVW